MLPQHHFPPQAAVPAFPLTHHSRAGCAALGRQFHLTPRSLCHPTESCFPPRSLCSGLALPTLQPAGAGGTQHCCTEPPKIPRSIPGPVEHPEGSLMGSSLGLCHLWLPAVPPTAKSHFCCCHPSVFSCSHENRLWTEAEGGPEEGMSCALLRRRSQPGLGRCNFILHGTEGCSKGNEGY